MATFHQVHFRHIGLRQSRFRLHDWTERALISFNAENCLGPKTTAPLTAIFTHQAYDAVADFKESFAAILDTPIG